MGFMGQMGGASNPFGFPGGMDFGADNDRKMGGAMDLGGMFPPPPPPIPAGQAPS